MLVLALAVFLIRERALCSALTSVYRLPDFLVFLLISDWLS